MGLPLVSSALIDLGEVPRAAPDGTLPAAVTQLPPRRHRTVLAVIAGLLAAMLSGAAHVAPPAAPRIVPARLGDATFVSADRLFVVSAGPAQVRNKVVRTYSLPAGALLSVTTVPATGQVRAVTAVAGQVLLSYQVDPFGAVATVAVADGTDRQVWYRRARVLGVSRGLVLLREDNFDVGSLYWYGLDLASGTVRWRLAQPIDGYTAATDVVDGFPRRLVSVDAAGRLVVRDSTTGSVVTATRIPAPAAWARDGAALWADGDLILVGDHSTASAYSLSRLTERWRAPVDLYTSYVRTGCGDAICLFSQGAGGMVVLDRATGRVRWTTDRWSSAEQFGPYLLVGDGDRVGPDPAPDVVDRNTGRLRATLGPWQRVGATVPGGVLVLRSEPAAAAVRYGLVNPVTLRVRVLGAAEPVYDDCQTTPDVLVCRRIDASVGIWRLARPA